LRPVSRGSPGQGGHPGADGEAGRTLPLTRHAAGQVPQHGIGRALGGLSSDAVLETAGRSQPFSKCLGELLAGVPCELFRRRAGPRPDKAGSGLRRSWSVTARPWIVNMEPRRRAAAIGQASSWLSRATRKGPRATIPRYSTSTRPRPLLDWHHGGTLKRKVGDSDRARTALKPVFALR